MKPIRSVLVANRGEIAVRVMRTCRRLGIFSMAVYSDADARTMHVAQADAAYRIGPPPAAESYLNVSAILEAARASGADAIHPGYGFLSENPEFAQGCIDAGLIWVGPSPAAMRAVGDKAQAKTLAEQHAVPVLPGYHDADQSSEVLRREAERIGVPLLIKASAGGGGRGMRIVRDFASFQEGLEAARREAKAAFGDDRVLLERYIEEPRHVEIQVFGDQHGNFVHLGERECSIQRRHQKLIEESPSPAVSAELREAMGAAALRLVRAAGYSNAGTVEFLLDQDGSFYFLEVNARLQVEHPVTEEVTGLDLVELQLRVASGEPLGLSQDDIKLNGHAIEVRVIAEDPLADFLPSSGRISRLSIESHPVLARADTWITEGTIISPHYDSLLAKVIVDSTDRDDALSRLRLVLQTMELEGVRNNVDLLLRVIEHPAFKAGDLHTGFLQEHGIVADLAEVPAEVVAAAAAFDVLRPRWFDDPWRSRSSWRLGRVGQPSVWVHGGRELTARIDHDPADAAVVVRVGDRTLRVRSHGSDGVTVDGRSVAVWQDHDPRVVEYEGRSYRFERAAPLSIDDTSQGLAASGGGGRLTAPMPGRIVKLAVSEGDTVRQNQPLVVLEAMKMEHVVEAPHAGVVAKLCVEQGEQVRAGAVLLELGEADQSRAVE